MTLAELSRNGQEKYNKFVSDGWFGQATNDRWPQDHQIDEKTARVESPQPYQGRAFFQNGRFYLHIQGRDNRTIYASAEIVSAD